MRRTYKSQRLDNEGPRTHKASYDKPAQDSLDFGNSTMPCINGIVSDECARANGEEYLVIPLDMHSV